MKTLGDGSSRRSAFGGRRRRRHRHPAFDQQPSGASTMLAAPRACRVQRQRRHVEGRRLPRTPSFTQQPVHGRSAADPRRRPRARRPRRAEQRSVSSGARAEGLGEPVKAYEDRGSPRFATAVLPTPISAGRERISFAGRDDEREALPEQWKSAGTTAAPSRSNSGQPGGQRTSRPSFHQLRTATGWVLVGRCDENIAAPTAPWIESCVTSSLTRRPAPRSARRSSGRRAHAARPRAASTSSQRARPRRPRCREPAARVSAPSSISSSGDADAPTLVVIDDVHWADGLSLGLLRHLVSVSRRSGPALPRDVSRHRRRPRASVSARIGDFRREPRVERFGLRARRDRVARLLTAAGVPSSTRSADSSPCSARPKATRSSSGKSSALVETSVLVQRDGVWTTATSIEEVGLPEGVRESSGAACLACLTTRTQRADRRRRRARVPRGYRREGLRCVPGHRPEHVELSIDAGSSTRSVMFPAA